MEVRAFRQTEAIVEYICDICHNTCAKDSSGDPLHTTEHATLRANWGYWSNNKDMTWNECHMCELCFEKVKRFIEVKLRGVVRSGESG